MDQAGRSRLLPSGLHIWRGLQPHAGLLRLDKISGDGTAAQEDGRKPAEVPVRLCRHVQTSLPPATQRRRSEVTYTCLYGAN